MRASALLPVLTLLALIITPGSVTLIAQSPDGRGVETRNAEGRGGEGRTPDGRNKGFFSRWGNSFRNPLGGRDSVEPPHPAPPPATTPGESSLNLRLRVTWGGGTPRAWQGELRAEDGELSDLSNLGREPDDPGSFELRQGVVQIAQPRPSPYGGCDISVSGAPHTRLILELAPRDQPTEVRRVELRLDLLVDQSQSQLLDAQQNHVHLARVPGDRLRLELDRDVLVFEPGEEFVLSVFPNAVGGDVTAANRLRIWLAKGRGEEELFRQEYDSQPTSDGSGRLAFGPLALTLPELEGVYDVHLELLPRRLPGGISIPRAKPIARRIVQLVVVSRTSPPVDSTPWKLLAEIDPTAEMPGSNGAANRWSDWLTRIPSLTPGATGARGPLGNERASVEEIRGRPLVSLSATGWMAYPLPVQRPDEPHVLEVEYPSERPQVLGISVVEPNAAGRVVPLGVDSGIEVGEPEAGHRPGWLRHRVLFWPRTRTPLVILVNRHATEPAWYGRIAVQAGPARLSAPPNEPGLATDNSTPPGSRPNGQRLAAALVDRPVFPENFGASEAYDPETDGVWDDWVTFYQGATRLIEYLKYSGYNGVVVSVACEGSAIYPSQLLEPTPKYDSGMFLSGGHDPLRKDVVELLFRLCDREGLRLIPAVQFSSPLPELERLRRQGGNQAVGIDLVTADGRTWGLTQAGRGSGTYYNMLDPRVRQATLRVLAELEQRYAHHESWSGLALQLGPDSYASFPGAAWGMDDATTALFRDETGLDVPGKGRDRYAERARFLGGEARSRWLSWRADSLTQWYAAARDVVAQRKPDSQLILAAGELIATAPLQQWARSSLPQKQTATDALLALGLAPKRIAEEPGIVLPRPYRWGPVTQLPAHGVNLEWNRSQELDRLMQGTSLSGGLSYHDVHPLAIPSFNEQSPFGPDKTHLWLAAHFTRSGDGARQRITRCLAAADVSLFIDGGWMLPLGGEESLRPTLAAFRQLPTTAFETVASTSAPQRPTITVRQSTVDGVTYVYVLNDAPWRVEVELLIAAPAAVRVEELGRRLSETNRADAGPLRPTSSALASDEAGKAEATTDQPGRWTQDDRGGSWNADLGPYDLRILRIEGEARVQDWRATVAPEVSARLSQQVKELRARANQLRNPPPLPHLKNANFELASGDTPSHWLHARGPGIQVASDNTTRHSGRRSLYLRSDGEVVWVRSDPFPTPASGRIAVWAWLRAGDPDQQPPVRLAIEGKLDGKTYYRYATVGGGSPHGAALQSNWTQYWFQIEDLPTNGLTDLRVGFDMMSAGEIWIDDVQLFDVWFHENERDELIKSIGLADFNLTNGRLVECARYLDSYWPRFLREHVPLDQRVVQGSPRRPVSPTATGTTPGDRSNAAPPVAEHPAAERPPEKTTWKDRIPGLWPRRGL